MQFFLDIETQALNCTIRRWPIVLRSFHVLEIKVGRVGKAFTELLALNFLTADGFLSKWKHRIRLTSLTRTCGSIFCPHLPHKLHFHSAHFFNCLRLLMSKLTTKFPHQLHTWHWFVTNAWLPWARITKWLSVQTNHTQFQPVAIAICHCLASSPPPPCSSSQQQC